MSVSETLKTAGRSSTDATSYTTDSVTLDSGKLYVLVVGVQIASGTSAAPTITQTGVTWTLEKQITVGLRNMAVFRAVVGSTQSATILIDYAGVTQAGCDWSVTELTGAKTTGTNGSDGIVQSVSNNAGAAMSLTITLAAFASADNATFGAIDHSANEDTTEGSGFTKLAGTFGTSPAKSMITQFRADNDTSVDASWASTQVSRGIALEIAAATGSTTLTVADGLHAHTADNVVLTQKHTLAVADGTHSHLAENVTVTQKHVLAVSDGSHSHTVDNVGVTQKHTLAVQDGTHNHLADTVTLSQKHTLAVSDGSHSHLADSPTLILDVALVVSDGLHGHTVDPIGLTQKHLLGVSDGLMGHTAESVLLSQKHVLVVSDGLHAHTVDAIILTIPGELSETYELTPIDLDSDVTSIDLESDVTSIDLEPETVHVELE